MSAGGDTAALALSCVSSRWPDRTCLESSEKAEVKPGRTIVKLVLDGLSLFKLLDTVSCQTEARRGLFNGRTIKEHVLPLVQAKAEFSVVNH